MVSRKPSRQFRRQPNATLLIRTQNRPRRQLKRKQVERDSSSRQHYAPPPTVLAIPRRSHSMTTSGRDLDKNHLGHINPPHGLRLIGSTFQLLRQFIQPSFPAVLFDVFESLVVYSRSSTIGLAAFVGIGQNVLPTHLVVHGIETKAGRFLRFCVQRYLQLLNTRWSC